MPVATVHRIKRGKSIVQGFLNPEGEGNAGSYPMQIPFELPPPTERIERGDRVQYTMVGGKVASLRKAPRTS